ncbi:MAG: hypothetical protein OER56_17540, partial [Hyphomicrobiales bacterium]|nr:hypothetical protein [Hyphomicrobiales bacterium]
MSSELPAYVERGGEQIFPPPWTITNGDFYGFLVTTDPATVQQRICDPLFNTPMNEPGRFEPAGDFVMIVYNNLPELMSTAPGWASKGIMAEHEMAFWSLVHDTTASRMFWVQSYMIVNRGRAVSTGREV